MTDKELIQWLRDEADYWTGEDAPSHPDGNEQQTVEMLNAAADRLERLSVNA